MLRPVNAAPIPQTLYSHSPYLVVQSGEASALGAYPIAPGPTWAPVLLVRGPVFQKIGPQKSERGLVYAITWRYEFQSVTPLNGNPAAWIGSG
jgi:hypothetical protein